MIGRVSRKVRITSDMDTVAFQMIRSHNAQRSWLKSSKRRDVMVFFESLEITRRTSKYCAFA